MSVIEKLNKARDRVLDTAAMVPVILESHGPDSTSDFLREGFSTSETLVQAKLKPITLQDLRNVNREVLYTYGFRKWEGELLLIPLWLSYFMEPNTEVESIFGEIYTIGELMTNSPRSNRSLYGFRYKYL